MGDLLAGYAYTWNQRGQLTAIDFLPDGINSAFDYSDEDVDYDYDNRHQLEGADYAGLTDEEYEYDQNGNRESGGHETGANNRLLTDGTYNYEYDNEGNRTKRTNISTGDYTVYVWDHRNRLVEVLDYDSSDDLTQEVDYSYDANNHLIKRVIDADGAGGGGIAQTVYVWHHGQIVLQFDKSGSGDLVYEDLSHRYLWGPAVDMLLADEQVDWSDSDADGEVLWALTDHLGTIRDIIDNEGDVLDHAEYDAFGNRLNAAAVDVVFGYTGKLFDEATGLQNNWNRWYDPAVGRWASEDFIWDGTNKNAYVGNSPAMFVDPDGLAEMPPSTSEPYVPFRDGLWSSMLDTIQYLDKILGGHQLKEDYRRYHAWADANRKKLPQIVQDCFQVMDETHGIGFGVPIGTMVPVGGFTPRSVPTTTTTTTVARTNAELIDEIGWRALRWGERKKLYPSGAAGSRQHAYARDLLNRFQSMFGNRGLSAEVRYVNKRPWEPGDPCTGSVILDVIEGSKAEPLQVWDYKFWKAILEQRRIEQMRRVAGIPDDVPISPIAIRPERPN